MKTAKAHRKFAIYSTFLDTILEGEEEIREGETRKDTLKRILAELEETAAELRKEANPGLLTPMNTGKFDDKFVFSNATHSLPTISLDKERLEILQDNIRDAQSLEELQKLKEDAGKAGLVSEYMDKMNKLLTGGQKDHVKQ